MFKSGDGEERPMKIRLLTNLPIDPKYGMKEGTVIEATLGENRERGGVWYWHTHASGEKIGILRREAEEVGEASDD